MGIGQRTFPGGLISVVGREVVVGRIEDLSPRIRRIRFYGDCVKTMNWVPGDKIKLQVSEGAKRSYTPSRLNGEEGWFEVVFHLHGNGPGSQWASFAKPGDGAHFIGPKSSMPRGEGPVDWALFFGDATTLGLAQALFESLPAITPRGGVIEIDSKDAPAIERLNLPLRAIPLGTWLDGGLQGLEVPKGDGLVWLSGHVDGVKAVKQALLHLGFPKSCFCVKPYWGKKKRPLRAHGEPDRTHALQAS